MCGIAGIVHYSNPSAAEESVRRMTDAMQHRGPDASGFWSNEACVLGHRRLSIIDTSEAGNQPFHSEDGSITLVFNGEIYNYLELRKSLKSDYTFKTNSDTEVIIAVYRTWGIEGVRRLNGMFAFGLWDNQAKKFFLVRDRVGIKPLYYVDAALGFAFASEIRSLLAGGVARRKINRKAIGEYLSYQTVHAPMTILEDVKMLPPGHHLVIDHKGSHIQRYWYPAAPRMIAEYDKREDALRDIAKTLKSGVAMQMRADVPFGAFLSGGIDSSAIVALMSEVSTQPISTFSIAFREKEFDEREHSRKIAKLYQTDHHEIELSADDFRKMIPEALASMDHPSGDGPNTYVVSKATRAAGIKMALSGLGGDEVFAGYDVFKRIHRINEMMWINRIPHFIRSQAGKTIQRYKPGPSGEKIRELLELKRITPHSAYTLTRKILPDAWIASIIGNTEQDDQFLQKDIMDSFHLDLPLLSNISMAEMQTYMQDVLLRDSDQMSMAHALEIRVPFLDHELIERVIRVRDNWKYPHTPKQLLTEALGNRIPDSIIHRPKMGFTFPWNQWMRGELKSFCEEQLNHLKRCDAIQHDAILALWQRFLNGDPSITWSRMWPMVVLGHWMNQHDIE
ncbi:MAG: asparagine synthase (glutamine-hydrolyzing) [Flavobacteriales bacterium]